MIAVVQRVHHCSVSIEQKEYSAISKGLCILLGIASGDTLEEADWLLNKMIQLRIFEDVTGKMNDSLEDIKGSLMIVSQFTLLASTKKGNRPSFIHAAPPDEAKKLYHYFVEKARQCNALEQVATGEFGADMILHIENDGPVTIILDTKNKQ
ncbi:MAG: D-aminoacyl-tRNA deacylase [Cytophagaceae bacterium]|jgi:D-tyrosyl-tRNA(Tyr) deacylase|nr:D-aminoacyl-tRNA deacylase [Cytophagaceae bacterium]